MVHWKYHGILKTAWMHSVLPRACVDETRHEARRFTFQVTFSRNSKAEAGASSTHLGLVLCLLLALRWLPLWDSISDTAEQGAGHSTDLPGEGLSCVCSPGHHAKGLQQGFMEHCREAGPERPRKEPEKARKSHPGVVALNQPHHLTFLHFTGDLESEAGQQGGLLLQTWLCLP